MSKKVIYGVIGVMILIGFAMLGASDSGDTNTQAENNPQPQQSLEIENFNISFDAEHISGRQFRVSGTTGLPNGSQLGVNVRDEGYFSYDGRDSDWRFENLTYLAGEVTVRDGEFSTVVSGSEMEAPMHSKDYEIEVSFNPVGQSSAIQQLVGSEGEKLSGSLVEESDYSGLKILSTTTVITTSYSDKL